MINRVLMIVAVILLLSTQTWAMTLEGRCAIRFFGQSTLHDFDGQAVCQPFTFQSERTEAGADLVRSPAVDVLVKEMDTDNSGRDEKMQAMFESDRYPVIRGLFADLEHDAVLQQLQAGETANGALDFELQIRDVTKPVHATTRELQVTPEQISFIMEFTLSLADYQLEPPSVLGLIRVDDQVRVEARVFLNRR